MSDNTKHLETSAGVIAGELLAKRLIASADVYRVKEIIAFHLRGNFGSKGDESTKYSSRRGTDAEVRVV